MKMGYCAKISSPIIDPQNTTVHCNPHISHTLVRFKCKNEGNIPSYFVPLSGLLWGLDGCLHCCTVVFWGSIIGLEISAQNRSFLVVKLEKWMKSED